MPLKNSYSGYYTASQAMKVLGITEGMFYNFIRNKDLVGTKLPGRKQNLYEKSKVDEIARELRMFVTTRKDAPATFMKASKEDLPQITEITKALFTDNEEEASRLTKLEDQIAFIEKNPYVYCVLKREDEVVGFIYMLPLKQNTDKIEKIFRSAYAGEAGVTPDDIETFEPGKHVHLYVTAVGVRPDLSHSKKRMYGSRLLSNLMGLIIDLGKQGVIIETITAAGGTPEGIRLMQNFGFSEVQPLKPGSRNFIIKIKESGTPEIMKYKEALSESGVFTFLPDFSWLPAQDLTTNIEKK